MRKSAVLLVAVTFLALAVASFAADQQQGQRKAVDPSLICLGVVKSVTMADDNKTLKSFVVTTAETPEKPATDVTINVTDKTKYMKAKNPATSADVVVGAKVMVRLKAALVENAGTAVAVRIMPAAAPHGGHGGKKK